MSERVNEILSWYDSANPGMKRADALKRLGAIVGIYNIGSVK